MAGIAGIIPFTAKHDRAVLSNALKQMIKGLSYSDNQVCNSYMQDCCYAANVLTLHVRKNDHFIKVPSLPYHILIDGLIYIREDDKLLIKNKYQIDYNSKDSEYLPYLFDIYEEEFGHHLTGWFNILIYDEQKKSSVLLNDRLGYMPLFYYHCDDFFLFSSKMESILNSGLICNMEVDQVTLAEHLFFNYPLSDNTYIKGIKTLPDASIVNLYNNKVQIQRYWEVGELFKAKAFNKKESIQLINKSLKSSIEKLLHNTNKNINFSLTGGWDSRVVLSYLLPKYQNRIQTYSFGAPEADDIRVPEYISQKEGFSYTPHKLDNDYIDNQFLNHARETICLSNGTRNYKRTHYVYAIKQIAEESNYLLSGIFGDEVFKVGKPMGGTVISKNAVDFIHSVFNVEEAMKQFRLSGIMNVINASEKHLLTELNNRLVEIKERYSKYKTSGERYFAFRFTLNLRKYFGNEVNSYNDFVYCFSPFIDYDFLKEFARTHYMVSRFGFEKPSIKLKAQSSWLYYKLTAMNNPGLTKYNSSRGFSMKATQSIFGIVDIILKKSLFKKLQRNKDGFNTKNTDALFREFLEKEEENSGSKILKDNSSLNSINSADLLSLRYYLNCLNKKYKIK